MRNGRKSARRGVLLVVVLGLLAMFGLVAVAFVVLSGHARRSAQAVQRIDQYYDPPERLLHQAAMQLFIGVPVNPAGTNLASVMSKDHSLLGDIYGNDFLLGQFNGVTPVCGGQLFQFQLPNQTEAPYQVGCVLTMLDGDAVGQSTRIVGISSDGQLQALAFDDGVPIPSGGKFVINGVPFSGTGFGWQAGAGAGLSPMALRPGAQENIFPLGGANEDYDAVDFQNMLLAGQMPIFDNGEIIRVRTIPSFHRPSLVNYWKTAGGGQGPDFWRTVILRPLQEDHQYFTGSNPNPNGFDPVNGPWDVDNDGDGWEDSIWVDLGMPVRSTSDGRLYKPLFAVLCIDMGGRLNLNAHGMPIQAIRESYKEGTYEYVDAGIQAEMHARFGNAVFANGNASFPLPRGLGGGPAEINLLPLFQYAGNNSYELYQRLLVGYPQWNLEGRYGELNTAGNSGAMPGVSGLDDPLSANRNFEYAGNYWSFLQGQEMLDSYGSPPDLYGTGAVGLDRAGQPLYIGMGQPSDNTSDDPYEIDLSLKRGRGMSTAVSPAFNIDNPFSPAEGERILRPFDRDADKLPSRLAALTHDGSNGPVRSILHQSRHSFTTDSWDLPCPGLGVTDGQRVRHVVDLLRARGVPDASLSAAAQQLLPPELTAGRRMNLNRPLGNGRDNSQQGQPGYGVVDESREAENGETFSQYATPNQRGDFSFDHANDNFSSSSPTAADAHARQILARHLYVLMKMVVDEKGLGQVLARQEPEGSVADKQKLVNRYLAQWAVNVVDFRDRDSIMTRFAYDPTPFDSNGWDPDGSALHTVWGCERPELLITETLAWHDRRTEDRDDEQHDPNEEGDNSEEAGKFKQEGEPDPKKKDASFDQRLRPEGSLFVELYNPWGRLHSQTNERLDPRTGELHTARNQGGGVELSRTSGNGASGSPVWRVIVCPTTEDDEPLDPDDPDQTKQPEIDRVVYFVPVGSATIPQEGKVRFTPGENTPTQVLSGRYCVIGPGNSGGSADPGTTYIGFRTGQDKGDATTRRIKLLPGSNDPEVVKNDTSSNPNKPPAGLIHPPSVMVIDHPRRLSVSEPDDGYTADGYADGAYTPPRDIPLDSERDDGLAEVLTTDQTVFAYRIVHLQRLANPLKAYHVEENPYRTIDSMAIDLSAFNGVTKDEDPHGNPKLADVRLHARQRGEKNAEPNTNNLWKQEPVKKVDENDEIGGGPGSHYMNKPLRHSLGYLNAEYFGAPLSNDPYRGDPQRPFPWLTWNNRPFVSHLELLLVPALRSSKLLVHNRSTPATYFSIAKTGVPYDPYEATSPETVPFQHLPNFFHSASADSQAPAAAHLYRLLEFVHVPSPFVGTTVQISPSVSATGNHWFHPPFNHVSRYRDPGKINLNTIFTRQTYLGLMNCFPGTNTDDSWRRFVQSRNPNSQGGRVISDPATLGSSSPTQFPQPFRSAGGASLVPSGVESLKFKNEIDATLLRAERGDLDQPGSRPLFRNDTASTAPNSPNNPDRNPYFHYQGLQRLGNLTTTRSNVYAIWITVGYFEVKPWGSVDAGHPDGYELATELGTDTGEIRRHRAFYMFDRSIPVGYIRGQNLNVEKAILVKRFIE